jgi:hypothetical protein
MSKYKIKINCTDIKYLSYNNSKISNKDREKYNFDDINYIDEVYVLHRKLIKENFILKSLEFIINKLLDINELQDFLIILKNKGFKSDSNTSVEFIDITENNNYIYLYKIRYNTYEINKYSNIINKRKSKYSQQEIYKR